MLPPRLCLTLRFAVVALVAAVVLIAASQLA
jgi:hypothetical protein